MPSRITPDLVLTTDLATDPRLSPSGSSVVWTAQPHGFEGDGFRASLWLAAAEGDEPPRRLTAAGDHRDHHPRWAPHGDRLAFLTDRAHRGVDSLALLPTTGGEAEVVVTREHRGITTFSWAPDGARLLVVAPDEPDDEERRREEEGDDAEVYGERWPFARLHVLDLGTGEPTPLVTGEVHVTEAIWAPGGDRIAYLAAPTPELHAQRDLELHVLDVTSGEQHTVAPAPHAEQLTWLGHVDEERLAWIGPAETTPQCGAVVRSVGVTGGDVRIETPADVCEIGLQPTVDGRDAVVHVADGLGSRLRWWDGEVLHDEPRGELRSFDVHRRAGVARTALLRSSAHEPWEIHLLEDRELRRLSRHQSGWDEVALATQEPFHWTAEDGLELDGLALRPRDVDGPLPTLVIVHGGPYGRWADGFAATLGNWGQWLADAGFQVLLPNPRGGMGHGDAFARRVRGRVGQEDFGDVLSMLDAAIERGLSDPDRVGIGGWSQGGFMAAWAVTQTERFRAAVVGAGVTDWGLLTMDTDVPDFEAALGGSRPWDGVGPHAAALNSPISFATRVTTPVLLLHGKEDARIPVNQAIGFARALREGDVEVEEVRYPRAGHAPRERRHQLDLYDRVRAWFERFV